MLRKLHKSLWALAAVIFAAISITPVQAQTWTNATTGLPLAIGQPVTVAGHLNLSLIYFINQTPCPVSIDGTVTASDTITFFQSTPGFTPCLAEFGDVQFPFDVKAQFSGVSPTGERATAINIVGYNPIGMCSALAIPFNWYDSPLSEATLPTSVAGGTCTLHAGSKMRVVAPVSMVGNVDIR